MIQAGSESAPSSGTLTVAVAPAGDTPDVTARFGAVLAAAGLIAVADPARLDRLVAATGIALAGRVVGLDGSSPVVGRDDSSPGGRVVGRDGSPSAGLVVGLDGSSPAARVPELLAELTAGQDVLLLTDSGLASADELGRSLVAAAAATGIRVIALPGLSPVTAALAIAGLSAERFVFEGVPPRRTEVRERRFAELAAESRTLIFSESAGQLARTLAELAAALGASRPAVVCRGLATVEQDVQRGSLGELAGELAGELTGAAQGDVTVVVAGAEIPDTGAAAAGPDVLAAAVAQVQAQVRDGTTTRDAVAAVAGQTGLRKRDLYNAVSSSR
ncbi:MAG: SAM-dependent methyltransferase [Streptosporangiaceae bacterium]